MHINGTWLSRTLYALSPNEAHSDDRNLPEVGRISRPDDIIASVRVEDGKVRPIYIVEEQKITSCSRSFR